jgi:hypothetical protein
MLFQDHLVIKEIQENIKKVLEFNENESITYQNICITAKAVLNGKFITMNAYIKNTERSQVNDLMLHLKILEKQEKAKPTARRRDIIKNKGQSQ